MINVLIVSNNQIFSELLDQYLSSSQEISIVGRFRLNEIKQTRCSTHPDIVLFSQRCNPLTIRREFLSVKRSFPDSKIIFISPEDDREEMEFNIIKMGAKGFLCARDPLKNLVKAIKISYSGEIWASRRSTDKIIKDLYDKEVSIKEDKVSGLTNQEKKVILLLTSGYKNAEIAQRLFISEKTVKTHINRIFKKIKVSNRLQAALWATKNLSDAYNPGII